MSKNLKKTVYKKIEIKKTSNKKILKIFLNSIEEKELKKEKKISNSPWKYMNKKNLNFRFVFFNKKIISVISYINTYYSRHLYFIFTHKNIRGLGLGEFLLRKYFLNTKKFKTIHVDQMQKIINFYKKFNFVVPTDHGHFLTQKWIKRCSNFSKNSLTNKKLLIEKKYT